MRTTREEVEKSRGSKRRKTEEIKKENKERKIKGTSREGYWREDPFFFFFFFFFFFPYLLLSDSGEDGEVWKARGDRERPGRKGESCGGAREKLEKREVEGREGREGPGRT